MKVHPWKNVHVSDGVSATARTDEPYRTVIGDDSHGTGVLGISEPDDGWTVIVWILAGAAVAGVVMLALTLGLRRR